MRRLDGAELVSLLLEGCACARQLGSLFGLRLVGICCHLTLVEEQLLQLLLHLVQLQQQHLVLALQLGHFGDAFICQLPGRSRCRGLGLQISRQLCFCRLGLRQ